MNKGIYIFIAAFFTLLSCTEKDASSLKLWYDQPASTKVVYNHRGRIDNSAWLSALPIGNGSLGAMVYGDVPTDHIQLNEESVWSGCPFDTDNPEAPKHLAKIRSLLFAGKYKEATELIEKTQICKSQGNPDPHYNGSHNRCYGSYQTLGDLWFDFDNKAEYSDYRRELDLETATLKVTYTQEGTRFRRDYFASQPDQVIVMKYTADKPGKLSFTCKLNRPQNFMTHAEKDQLVMSGICSAGSKDGMEYMARLCAVNKNGSVSYTDSTLRVDNADEVLLLFTASTDYKMEYPTYKGRDYAGITAKNLENARNKSYKEMRDAHLKEYTPYFKRVDFHLAGSTDTLPTDLSRSKAEKDTINPHLYELMFQYGRYLMISSSRPGTMPANLQGIWAMGMSNPWKCDYHTDVNIEMNYWMAEVANLSECHLPYFDLLEALVEPGSRTARIQYNMNGWVVHPITNVWGFTSPGESASWGMHTGAPAWLCQHIMEHYRFTGDKEFLKRMYPVLKGAVEFYMDWLTVDPETGKLVSGPAVSPENSFIAPDGTKSQFTMGPTHDQQTIWQLFEDIIQAAGILKSDNNFIQKVRDTQANLLGTQIGKDGRIMEWAHEFKEVEPGHRHISHLFAIHPGSQINMIQTPELAKAAIKSMDYRIAHGGGGTGWSSAWLVNQYARTLRPEEALKSLNKLIGKRTSPNLFTMHPPFQIDANFGATAGISEMLLQSHVFDKGAYIIQLLPAIPESWSEGSFSGLKARGGFEISATWKAGKLVQADIKSLLGNKCRILYDGSYLEPEIRKGETWTWSAKK